jgi:Spectrin repeat.
MFEKSEYIGISCSFLICSLGCLLIQNQSFLFTGVVFYKYAMNKKWKRVWDYKLCSKLTKLNISNDCKCFSEVSKCDNNMILGRDLIGVQNLIKKHQAVLAEINNHENRIAAVCQSGQQMMDDGHFASDEIKQRVGTLNDHWTQLKEKALQV